jgi:protease-4
MRVIVFLLKCLVGLLASVGLLVVAAVVVVAVLSSQAAPWATLAPKVPDEAVLSLDLSAGIIEARPEHPFARLSLGSVLVMRDAVEALEAGGRDPKVKGLIARLGIGPLGIAQAQELRAAIADFRAQGKFAVAFAESFGEGGDGTLHYYLASAFEEVWVQPSGNLDITGILIEAPFLREVLDDWGILPRVAQREEYKGAASFVTDRSLPEPQRENLQRLVDSWSEQIAGDVAQGRGMEAADVLELIDRAPHAAADALDKRLVDRLGYWDEMTDAVYERAGDDAEFFDLMDYAARGQPLPATGPKVALIYGLGQVMLAGSEYDPAFGRMTLGSDTIGEAIATAVDDPEIAAIVLRIDSPGGSYVASDAIWREAQLAREAGKPLIVSMSNVAASGGYFIAAPAHKIVALPGTITGSIGVVAGKLVLTEFWKDLGIAWDGVRTGDAAGFWSMNEDFSAAEWLRLQDSLDRIYADFTTKVAAGRELTPEAVAAAAKGQIWTGADAKEHGLVDELGGLGRAFALAAEAAGRPGERLRVKVLPEPRDPLEVLLEDALAGKLEGPGLGALLRDLARIAAVLRPLTEALEGLSTSPRLQAPDLRPVAN